MRNRPSNIILICYNNSKKLSNLNEHMKVRNKKVEEIHSKLGRYRTLDIPYIDIKAKILNIKTRMVSNTKGKVLKECRWKR